MWPDPEGLFGQGAPQPQPERFGFMPAWIASSFHDVSFEWWF